MRTPAFLFLTCALLLAQGAWASPCEAEFRDFMGVIARQNGKTLREVIAETGGEPRFHQSFLEFAGRAKAKGQERLRLMLTNAMQADTDEDRAARPLLACMDHNYDILEIPKPAAKAPQKPGAAKPPAQK